MNRHRDSLQHLLLALLQTLGLLMPLLGVLFPGFRTYGVLLPALALLLLLEAASLRRAWAWALGGALALLFLVWLFLGGGLTVCSDFFLALTLEATGRGAALPLVMDQAVPVLALAAALFSWLLTLRAVSHLPSLLLTVGMVFLVWYSGSPALTLWLLPGLAASVALLIQDRHESVSLFRVLPWILGAALAAFLLAPRGDPSWPPLRQRAEDLRQAVMDRLFYTEPRDVFSLSSEGLYPRGGSLLGGVPEVSDHVVMQVSSPRTVYLRGVVLDAYDGRSWRNTAGGRRNLWQSAALSAERTRLFDQDLPASSLDSTLLRPLTVSVRMLSDSASTLFVPQRIRSLEPGGGLVPYFSNASEIFITRNLHAGDTWTVSAPLLLGGDPGLGTLVDAAASLGSDPDEAFLARYLALPEHLELPLFELAARVADAAATPYEKALSLQSWLVRNCRYTLEVSPQPENVDFVTRFLLDTREGYCTYFASALTVLCRMAGLPARYVEGYLAEPDVTGNALVTGLQAHAWTEVWFRGFGWIPFDATPRSRGDGDPSGSTASQTPSPIPEETPSPEPPQDPDSPETTPEPDPTPELETPSEDEPSPSPEQSPAPEPPEDTNRVSFPWLLLLPLLLLLALALRLWLTSPRRLERRAPDDEARFSVWMQSISDSLAAEGLARRPGESPMAFARRVDLTGRFSAALSPVGECVSLLRYGAVAPLESDLSLVRDTARILRKDLSAPARLRALLRRLFVPLSRRRWTD